MMGRCADVRMCGCADVRMPARIPRSGETGANVRMPARIPRSGETGADVRMCRCADVIGVD
jgi:hypothetical protein